MLVAEDLKLGGPMAGRPIIYGVVRASAPFSLVFITFHVVETVGLGLIHGSSLSKSVPAIGGGGTLGLLTVAAILFIALLPYLAFREISRQLGPGVLNKLLFGSPTNRGA
jgi:hypothetical protein